MMLHDSSTTQITPSKQQVKQGAWLGVIRVLIRDQAPGAKKVVIRTRILAGTGGSVFTIPGVQT